MFLVAAWAQASDPAPPLDDVVARMKAALGGGPGHQSLQDGTPIDFAFRRSVRDVLTGKVLTADHRYVVADGGTSLRLDIRIIEGEGVDSATVVRGDRAWLFTAAGRNDVAPEIARSRLLEFAPQHLFSVPLAIAADAEGLVADASMAVLGHVDDGGRRRLILTGRDEDGLERARLELDAATSLLSVVAFVSPAGHVQYRYADYREITRGLVLPFRREFHRNGQLQSTISVQRLRLVAPSEPGLFDPEAGTLAPIQPGGTNASPPPKTKTRR
jgi:hypothetical protein